MKFLFFLALGYYAYRFLIKPKLSNLSPEEEEPTFRFEKKTKPRKQADEDDYIDYEEVK